MPLDRNTEAIAHFVGDFHLDIEALRLRDSYDAFRAVQDNPEAPGEPVHINISIRAPYDLKGFDPEMPVGPPPGQVFHAVATSSVAGPAAAVAAPGYTVAVANVHNLPPAQMQAPGGVSYHWLVPPPNSIATVTQQFLRLSDNDLLVFGQDHAFVDIAAYDAWLGELAGRAAELSPGLATLLPTGNVPALDDAVSLAAAVDALEAPAVEGAAITLMRGEDATGTIVNGSSAEEMPDFVENMPASLRPVEAEETEDLPPMTPLGDDPNPFAVEPGHHVTTGGNLSANEAIIVSNWVDAGVIAVAGDVVNLDIISQVAVLSEGFSPGGAAVSAVVNAARIATESADPAPVEGDPDPAAPAGPPVLPIAWETTIVQGDVILFNWVRQDAFSTDHDRIEVMISATSTSIVMGENTLSNLTTMVELGFHYDLIMVGSNMYSINMIEQTLVLLDQDLVSGPGAVWGSMPATVVGGGNYLQNSATIDHTGLDQMAPLTDTFRTGLDSMAEGGLTVSSAVAADTLFEGSETLSVLYITGDFIEVNVIQQTNHVGDADQVYLALEEFMAQAQGEVTVTTGENALLNSATIVDEGVDSVIMAGGEVYSDALIYQAGLIDMDAAPEGVSCQGLANEAVAFLASDMIDTPVEMEEAGCGDLDTGSGHFDVMQTLLS